MPRKQLEILKDLLIAHRDGDETRYQEIAREYVRYLRWKGFHNKAMEFEEILGSFEGVEEFKTTRKIPEPTLPLFKFMKKEPPKKKTGKRNECTWQVERGAEINFIQMQRLLTILIQKGKSHYSTKEVAEITGYSKDKAGGFSRLLHYLGLIENQTKVPTKLSKIIFRVDPYFEDLGTLWFLHYRISSNPEFIIWNRVANHLMTQAQFTLTNAEDILQDQRYYHTDYAFKLILTKEFRVIMKAYIESAFKKLNLLTTEDNQIFIRTNTQSIPDEILLAAILFYKQHFYADEVALEIKTLLQAENSPGRLFYLKEHKFREALERLRKNGYITIESFADLDQIKFSQTTDYLEQLKNYYHHKFGV